MIVLLGGGGGISLVVILDGRNILKVLLNKEIVAEIHLLLSSFRNKKVIRLRRQLRLSFYVEALIIRLMVFF